MMATNTSLKRLGAAHGRFQPLHHGHMEYLLAAKSKCEFLIVGITNPDPEFDITNNINPRRSEPSANPFTYYERLLMVRGSLLEAGLGRDEFEIVPFPINTPSRIHFYVPNDAIHYLTIYDDWGFEKVRLLRSMNFSTEVLWIRNMDQRITSGTNVRRAIAHDDNWQSLVPRPVSSVIINLGLANKVKSLMNN